MIRPALLTTSTATIIVSTLAVGLALAVSACAPAAPVGKARFANAPAVTVVADTADVPHRPRTRHFAVMRYHFDVAFHDPVVGALRFDGPRRAMDVNALDEVPDSTWFQHRAPTPSEVFRGPGGVGPAPGPWTVVSSKGTGMAAGFVMEDAGGNRFMLKFDEKSYPLVETASDIVAQRLLWAIGYHVPDDNLVLFAPSRLHVGKNAVMVDAFGNKSPMKPADLAAILARADRRPDGRYRALASRFLPGKPIGGFAGHGVRPDDPNDTIPHEHRRSVRALETVFGWLQQTDAKDDNTLDVWVDEGGSRHVRHYLVDFGKALGAMGLQEARPGDGHVHTVDPGATVRGVATLGLEKKPYEGVELTGLRGVALFDADHYQPSRWRSTMPWAPFDHVDSADRFWAARQIARLTPGHIQAAVAAAQYDDPRAATYVADVLIARREKLLRWAFSEVAPLDGFAMRGNMLCFEDLGIAHGVADVAGTGYRAAQFDYDGTQTGTLATVHPDIYGGACLLGISAGPSHDGYAIVRIAASRGGTVEVHIAHDGRKGQRVIGIERR